MENIPGRNLRDGHSAAHNEGRVASGHPLERSMAEIGFNAVQKECPGFQTVFPRRIDFERHRFARLSPDAVRRLPVAAPST